MVSGKKRLVVIGYGGMGGWHTQHALNSDVVELAGIYDINPERGALAESRGIKSYPSFEAVLEDRTVDLLTIATPNECHKPLAIQALEVGKNVISEKPVTLSCDDLQQMIDASVRTGKLFTVHQNRRWDVDFLAMKKLYDSGELGKIVSIESRIHGSRGIPSDWRGEKEHGGGMLYDWGIHLIDQIMQIVREPVVSVYCRFEHTTNMEVDDGFKLTLGFEGGTEAYIEVGTINFIPMPRFYMRGMKGTAKIEDWREPCHVVLCTHWHESEVIPVQTAAGLTKTMAPRDEVTTKSYDMERPQSDVHDFYRNVVRAIDGIEPQLVDHVTMMRVLRVIEASFSSAEQGQVLTVRI